MSWSDCGQLSDDRKSAACGSQLEGGRNMPSSTHFASLLMLASLKMWSNGGVRKGMLLACVNCQLALVKHACSNSDFWWCSFRMPLLVLGAITRDKGLWITDLLSACFTVFAVLRIFSVHQSCCHRAFFFLFQATACAEISCAIHVSCLFCLTSTSGTVCRPSRLFLQGFNVVVAWVRYCINVCFLGLWP